MIIIIVAILVVFFRYYLLSEPGYKGDIYWQHVWYQTILTKGFWGLYTPNYYPALDYPPFMPLIGAIWFWPYNHIPSINHLDFYLYFKLLPTLFEIILIILISRIIWFSKSKYRILLVILTIIQPGLAIVSSAWGQCDSLLALLLVLAIITISREKYFLTTFILFLAILTKPQAIIMLLFYGIVLISRKKYLELVYQILIFSFLIACIYVISSFFGHTNLLLPFSGAIGRYKMLSGNALNLWWGIYGKASFGMNDTLLVQILPFITKIQLRQIGLSLFAIFSLPGIVYLYYNNKKIADLALVSGYFYLIFFTFPSQIHERYLYYSVALFAIAAIKDKKIILIYIISTLSIFLNCFSVLHEWFKGYYPSISFSFLYTSYAIILCWVNVAMCVLLALYFLKQIIRQRQKHTITKY
ncbi:MAG: hypothetical protein WCO23_02980 [bacterium]